MTLSQFIKSIDDKMTAEQFRGARVQHLKLTQQAMGEKIGMSKSAVEKFEYGSRSVPAYIAKALVNILKLEKQEGKTQK